MGKDTYGEGYKRTFGDLTAFDITECTNFSPLNHGKKRIPGKLWGSTGPLSTGLLICPILLCEFRAHITNWFLRGKENGGP